MMILLMCLRVDVLIMLDVYSAGEKTIAVQMVVRFEPFAVEKVDLSSFRIVKRYQRC